MNVTLDDAASLYVTDLLKTGLYGADAQEVVETLVLRGIREAIDLKMIKVRTFAAEIEE